MWVPSVPTCAPPLLPPAGGYAVLKGIQQGLALPADSMIPSFAALRDYGNTSCSTTWYVMAYTESCRDVRRGDVLLQVGRTRAGGRCLCGHVHVLPRRCLACVLSAAWNVASMLLS